MTAAAAAPPRCPFSRSFSYASGEYTISLDYAGLTVLMDRVFDLWDLVESKAIRDEKPPEPGTPAAAIVIDEKRIGDAFEALVEHVAGLREWTGWDGVPTRYLVAEAKP